MTTPDKVGQRVRLGLKWTAMGIASIRLSRFLANIVLARLLPIEAFGIVAMANASIILMASLREAGLGQAYIQRRTLEDEGPNEAIDTVFVSLLTLNVLLFGCVIAAAPWVASFFDSDADAVRPVIYAMAFLFLMDTFVATPEFVLQRSMSFDRIARAQLAGAAVNATTAVLAALLGAGVWSLVLGQLSERLVLAVGLSAQADWSPGFGGSWRVARGLLGFGKYLWGNAMVRSIGSVMDRVVVGKVSGSTALGGYAQAFAICNLPATLISQVVNRVALPAMSRMQEDIPRIRAAFLKGVEHVGFLALPVGLGLVSVSEVMVPVIYGEKWRPIAPVVDVLSGYSAVFAVASVCGPALQALGRPRFFFFSQLARQGLALMLFALFASRGEVAVAWSVLAALVTVSIAGFVLIARLLQVSASQLIGSVAGSLSAALGMIGLVYLARRSIPAGVSEALELVVAIVTGVLGYAILSLALNRRMVQKFARTVGEVVGTRTV